MKPTCEESHLNFAFKCNLRHYSKGSKTCTGSAVAANTIYPGTAAGAAACQIATFTNLSHATTYDLLTIITHVNSTTASDNTPATRRATRTIHLNPPSLGNHSWNP